MAPRDDDRDKLPEPVHDEPSDPRGDFDDDRDDQMIYVRMTRRELRQTREAVRLVTNVGWVMTWMQKVGVWLAAVGVAVAFARSSFPQFFGGGGK